jgi:L-ascorbate metabolism protein UlaG (beta-lactamase superfamily)
VTRRRILFYTGAGAIAAPALFYFMDPLGAARYRGRQSDHFDGRRFHNPGPFEERGLRDLIRWRRTADPAPWPEWVPAPPGLPPERNVPDLRVTHVNHSTVLLQMNGVNVLTDPVWSKRASPVWFAGPRRHRAPGVRFEDLPPIDLILVSHNHYDHLDLETLRRLVAAHRPRVIVPLGMSRFLVAHGVPNAVELDWWDAAPGPGALRVACVPARHFSGRGLRDRNAALWCGFVVEGPAGPVYFAGDTGWAEHFGRIRERFGPVRLALLPIGAFRPRWFMAPVHMSPEEAVRAHAELGASTSIGIHYGTFRLADDGFGEPSRELARALEGAQNPRFWLLPAGEGRDIPGNVPGRGTPGRDLTGGRVAGTQCPG